MNHQSHSAHHRAQPSRVRPLLFVVLLSACPVLRLSAQTTPETSTQTIDTTTLPDAPSAIATGQQIAPASSPGIQAVHEPTVHIKGVVSDLHGGLIPGAHITASAQGMPGDYQTIADANGFFSLSDLPAGNWSITITAPGFETYTLANIRLKPGETYALPEVALPIARTSADAEVTLTQEQLAETELHAVLQQRVLGVLPNFYTSYLWDAAPLTARQKLRLSAHAAIDPGFLGVTAITAGIQHANNTFPEYGPGPAGYFSRYGADYGDAVISRLFGSVLYASLFRQDPRYFVMTNGSIRKRAWHAIASTVVARGDNRHWQPAYAHILGDVSAGLIATTYHRGTNPGRVVFDNTIGNLPGEAVNNLVREFLFRYLARHIPTYAKGKPPEE